DRLGLLLDEKTKGTPGAAAAGPKAGDLVLDLRERNLTADTDGWQLAVASTEGWVTKVGPPDPSRKQTSYCVWARTEKEEKRPPRVETGDPITEFTFLPPRADNGTRLVAVASSDGGRPTLALYDAATKKRVALLPGHDAAVRGLAFSDDGKLLASVGEDQTVRL